MFSALSMIRKNNITKGKKKEKERLSIVVRVLAVLLADSIAIHTCAHVAHIDLFLCPDFLVNVVIIVIVIDSLKASNILLREI
jgi:hypothetical protein